MFSQTINKNCMHYGFNIVLNFQQINNVEIRRIKLFHLMICSIKTETYVVLSVMD